MHCTARHGSSACAQATAAHSIFRRFTSAITAAEAEAAAATDDQSQDQIQRILNLYPIRHGQQQPCADRQSFMRKLKACATSSDVSEGRRIHAQIRNAGLERDRFVATALLSMYSKFGFPEDARQVFDEMPPPERDTVCWNALLSAYACNDRSDEALRLFGSMNLQKNDRLRADRFTVSTMLGVCARMRNQGKLQLLQILHGFALRHGVLDFDCFVATGLIHAYARASDPDRAMRVFSAARKNLTSWNAMIAGFLDNGCRGRALDLLRQMQGSSAVSPTSATLATAMAAAACFCLRFGKELHQYALKRSMDSDRFVATALVDMYSKFGEISDARLVFERLQRGSNVVAWNSMIAGYLKNRMFHEALDLFTEATNSYHVRHDFMSISGILCVVSHLQLLREGQEIHGYVMRDLALRSHPHVASALVTMYAKSCMIEDACTVFQTMADQERDAVLWASIICGLAFSGNHAKALHFFRQMIQQIHSGPDSTIVSGIAPSVSTTKKIEYGHQIHGYAARNALLEHDLFAGTAIVDMYAKLGDMESARLVFLRMKRRNSVTWNALIAGYTQNRSPDEALKCLQNMQFEEEEGLLLQIDSVTVVGVLPACASLTSLLHGMETHACVYRRGFDADPFVSSSLIDMYAKCGCLHDAALVFQRIPAPPLSAWNAIIAAYGFHGLGKQALGLFHKMQRTGPSPDRITFIALLSACSHAGMIQQGCGFFHGMRKYGISPGLEHYSCMVDLLGRAGLLEDAYALIQSISEMHMEPDSMIWTALLGACNMHCNVEIGEIAAKELLLLEPQEAGHYVSLANLYFLAGRWEDAAKMKRMMKLRGLRKSTGWSWITVSGKVHVFSAGDTSHPDSQRIYALLNQLHQQISAACIPV